MEDKDARMQGDLAIAREHKLFLLIDAHTGCITTKGDQKNTYMQPGAACIGWKWQ
jgi:hypothetical protein